MNKKTTKTKAGQPPLLEMLEKKESGGSTRATAASKAVNSSPPPAATKGAASSPPPQHVPPEAAPAPKVPTGVEAPDEEPKKEKTMGSKKRSAIDKQAREENLSYLERKKIALGREKKNVDRIIFILGNGKTKWFKAFNRSALYFEKIVAPRIKSKIIARPDTDYTNTAKAERFVSYPDIEALIRKLDKIGITLEDKKDDIYIFKLPQKVTPEELNTYIMQSEEDLKQADKNLVPKKLMTELFYLTRELHHMIYNMLGRMSGTAKEAVGYELERDVRMMMRKYRRLANKGTDTLKVLDEMFWILEDVSSDVSMMVGTTIDSNAKIRDLSLQIMAVRKRIKMDIKINKSHQVEEEYK